MQSRPERPANPLGSIEQLKEAEAGGLISSCRQWAARRTTRATRTAFDWRAYANRADGLRLLRASKAHVDTQLVTRDGYTDYIHWQVFQALCPKLLEASKLSAERAQNGCQTLILPDQIGGSIARQLVQCAYGEQLDSLRPSNLEQFYLSAVEFQIEHTIRVCLNYAKRLLTEQNSIEMLLLALHHRHLKLRRAAYAMIRANFRLLLQTNRQLDLLPARWMCRLLHDDHLDLNKDEELVWAAIVRWTRREWLDRDQIAELYNRMLQLADTDWLAKSANPSQLQFQLRQRPVGGQQLMLDFYTAPRCSASQAVGISGNSCSLLDCPIRVTLDEGRLMSERNEHNLYKLLKCLRFLRFRSSRAFDVMLEESFVLKNDRLSSLVEHMRLTYIVHHNLPLAEAPQVPQEWVERVRQAQLAPRERLLKSLGELVRCHLSSSHFHPTTERLDSGEISVAPAKQVVGEQSKEPRRRLFAIRLSRGSLRRAEQPRVPDSLALLVGGWCDGQVSRSMLAYDFVCDKWFKLSIRLPEPRAFHAVCVHPSGGQVYIFGGTNGEQILDSVLQFEPARDVCVISAASRTGGDHTSGKQRSTWRGFGWRGRPSKVVCKFQSLASMRERRCHLSGVLHTDGKLYALGGHNGQQRLRSAERLDLERNEWSDIADMSIARADASACSYENRIFVAGGLISAQFVQSSVEFYKPLDDTWTFAAPMLIPRMSFKLASFRGHLLAVGGTNGLVNADEIASVTRSVERYDFQHSSWSLCAPMSQKRSSFGLACIGDQLLVAGGHGGQRRLKSCEALRIGRLRIPEAQLQHQQLSRAADIQPAHAQGHAEVQARQLGRTSSPVRSAMRWSERSTLPDKRSGFSIAVIQKLPNAGDFTHFGSTKTAKGRRPSSSLIKRKGRWHRLKLMRRRKLMKHLKMALVVTVVVLVLAH